jgi:hypothetical protein
VTEFGCHVSRREADGILYTIYYQNATSAVEITYEAPADEVDITIYYRGSGQRLYDISYGKPGAKRLPSRFPFAVDPTPKYVAKYLSVACDLIHQYAVHHLRGDFPM